MPRFRFAFPDFALSSCILALAPIVALTLAAAPASAAPQITSVAGCTDVVNETIDCPAAGGVALTITGSDFGASSGVVRIDANECTSPLWDPGTIVCTLPPGTGAARTVTVADTAGVVSDPERLVSYQAPQITSVSGCPSGDVDCPRVGGTSITVNGANFGASGASVLVGDAACVATFQLNSAVICNTPPGAGENVPVVVVTEGGGLTTVPGSLSYEACPPGTRVDGNNCQACPLGFFSNEANAASCQPCPAGTASSNTAAQSCDNCEAGRYQGGTGGTTCQDCPAGTHSVEGAPACLGRDVMQCWKAKDLKNPRFTKLDDVSVDDDLSTGALVDVKKPSHVCLAADVASAGTVDPSAYQCCYKIAGAKLDPPVVYDTTDSIGNGLSVEVKKRNLICEPCSLVEVP